MENKNVSVGFVSFVEIEYTRALGLCQESDIVAYENERFKGC